MLEEFDAPSVTSSQNFEPSLFNKLTGVMNNRTNSDQDMSLPSETGEVKVKKQGNCARIFPPTLSLLYILLSAYCFYAVDIEPFFDFGANGKSKASVTNWDIANWSIYTLLLLMVLWSFF